MSLSAEILSAMSSDSDSDLEKAPKRFRINRKTVGLTYACPVGVSPNPISLAGGTLALQHFLQSKGDCEYLVSREQHQSGEDHYHVAVRYAKKLDTRDTRFFDYQGVHPNIIEPTSFANWCKYVGKDGDYLTNFYVAKTNNSVYQQALTSPSVAEGLSLIASKDPRHYLTFRTQLERNLEAHLQSGVPPPTLPTDRPWTPTALALRETILTSKSSFSIILQGPPNIGKTTLVLDLFPNALIVSHMDDLKTLTTKHEAIIFDDMSFSHLPTSGRIHLLDLALPRSVHARYRCVTIPAKMPRIFTTNVADLMINPVVDTMDQQAAIRRRCLTLIVTESLYCNE